MTSTYFREAVMKWVDSWRTDIWNWEPWTHFFFPFDNSLINAQPGKLENVCLQWAGERWQHHELLAPCFVLYIKLMEKMERREFFSPRAPRSKGLLGHLLTYCWFWKVPSHVEKQKHIRPLLQILRRLDEKPVSSVCKRYLPSDESWSQITIKICYFIDKHFV